MQIGDRMENRQMNGLAELEAKEDVQGIDALYTVTLQLTVRARIEAIAPRYAVENMIKALHGVTILTRAKHTLSRECASQTHSF